LIEDKVNHIKKFNNAMYVLFEDYIPTEANCEKKMMYMKGGTTFEGFDHSDKSHPLHPCTVCTDFYITSGKDCYRSKVLFKLKKIGAIPDFNWRLDPEASKKLYKVEHGG
jgi:hypothetical protein